MIPQREGRRILMPPRTSSGASNAVIDLTQTSPNPNAAHPSNEDEREQQEEHEDDYDEQQEFIHEHPNGSDNDSDVDMNNRHVYHDMNPFLHSSDSEDRHLDSGEDVHSDSDARGSSDARESDGDGSSDGVEVISSNERANRTRSRLSSDSDEFVSHTRALRSRHRDVYADAESGRARNQLVLQRLRQRHLQHPSLGSEQDDEDPDAALARRLQEEEYSGVQSSNVEDNVQRLLGILESENVDDDNEENEDDHDDEGGEETELDQDCIPRANNALNDALNDYRAIHRTRHSLLLDTSGSSSSRTSTRQRAGRRRGRSSRAAGANDDEPDALHDILVGMEWGGGGTRGRRGRGRGRGRGAPDFLGASHFGVLGGLIPELYGAGVAYNPANYVADDHFDDSYESLMSLGERIGTAKPKGLSKRVIDALPSKTFKGDISAEISSKGKAAVDTSTKEADQDAKCSICLTEFEAGESICGLPCLHWFHRGCIQTWLGTSKVCPICRTNVE